jgi:hypothetical protein
MTPLDWPFWAQIVRAYVIVQRLAELAYAANMGGTIIRCSSCSTVAG